MSATSGFPATTSAKSGFPATTSATSGFPATTSPGKPLPRSNRLVLRTADASGYGLNLVLITSAYRGMVGRIIVTAV